MIKHRIPMQQYRQFEGLSKHELDKFSIAPSYYEWSLSQEFKPSKSMEIGTLVHSLVLEDRVDYAVGPTVDRRTTAGKAEWAEFCANNIGKTIITKDEESTILGCQEACRPFIKQFFYDKENDVECSMFWEREGVACKGRPDIIGHFNGDYCIIDLKTTNDILSFDRSFWNFRYHIQAAWYRRGLEIITQKNVEFYFLVVDTNAPHLCQIVSPSARVLAGADILIDRELEKFKYCQQHGFDGGLESVRSIDIK